MKVVIMAGGRGTRISELFPDIPKPLIPIDGIPVLEREVCSLASQGFRDIILTVSYLHEKIEEHFGDGSKWGVKIEYFVENTPLGNAGALFKLNLKEDFLLLNADAMFDVDFNRFVDFHKQHGGLVTLFTVANKAMYDAMDESQRHIVANGYQAPCSGYFGQMTRCNGDTAFYNFYCDDGSIVENVQVSISNFGKVDNVRYDNIGFIFWSIEALNRDGQWEIVGYATTAVVGGDVVKYIETVGFATVRYNDENPWAILETFDAV